MAAKISTKGHVELPPAMRRKVGLRAGDPVEFSLAGDRIVIKRKKTRAGRKFKASIIQDPITGFPVLSAGPDVAMLTNEEVTAILAGFP